MNIHQFGVIVHEVGKDDRLVDGEVQMSFVLLTAVFHHFHRRLDVGYDRRHGTQSFGFGRYVVRYQFLRVHFLIVAASAQVLYKLQGSICHPRLIRNDLRIIKRFSFVIRYDDSRGFLLADRQSA